VLGVSWEGVGKLAWLDARTLKPSGRRLAIGPPPTGVAARSPDGRTIALSSGIKAELRFVDVRALRATGRIAIQGSGSLRESIWPSSNRLVAVRSGLDAEVVVVDPRARRVLERRPLEGQPLYFIPAGRRLVALFAPQGTIGQARLVVIDENASVRTLPLPGVEAGFMPPKSDREVGRHASPGLAVDARGTRAVVVTPQVVLEVDLDALAVVRQHRVLARAPAGVTKVIEGWRRGVLWLDGDTVAVSGSTDVAEGDRLKRVWTGVELVDVGSGTRRILDSTAIGATKAGNVLLIFGGSALRGYDLAGNQRFELLRGRDTGYVQTAGRWIYVGRDNSTTFTVVDGRTGKVVGTARTPHPTIVLGK
jgi:DNA-binding beta-propeller fold protein YncE